MKVIASLALFSMAFLQVKGAVQPGTGVLSINTPTQGSNLRSENTVLQNGQQFQQGQQGSGNRQQPPQQRGNWENGQEGGQPLRQGQNGGQQGGKWPNTQVGGQGQNAGQFGGQNGGQQRNQRQQQGQGNQGTYVGNGFNIAQNGQGPQG